jgi:hypothetical protein
MITILDFYPISINLNLILPKRMKIFLVGTRLITLQYQTCSLILNLLYEEI